VAETTGGVGENGVPTVRQSFCNLKNNMLYIDDAMGNHESRILAVSMWL
jgi:hypothetical protein